MTATIRGFEPLYIQRIAQLTNKSNQFNLTTLRCSEDDIRAMAEDDNRLCLCGKLVDKFGDNGIVTVVSGEQQETDLHLRLWLMSCRVLKRGMEDAMMDTLVSEAAGRGVKPCMDITIPQLRMQWCGNSTGVLALRKSVRMRPAIPFGNWTWLRICRVIRI